MAIMKGTGMLRELAKSQLITVFATLCISLPLFYFFGLRGIVPSLVMVSFASMVITCSYSFRSFPYRIKPFSRATLVKGFGMIKLGIYFTITSSVSNYRREHGRSPAWISGQTKGGAPLRGSRQSPRRLPCRQCPPQCAPSGTDRRSCGS